MMASVFLITIRATDNATAAVKRVKDSIGKITRPITDIKRSSVALGRELGLGKVAAGFSWIGRTAAHAAGGVAKIIAPMSALVGVGSIAGIAALATEWGHLGFEIGNTATNLGVTTSDLQSLRGAAELAGVSSESLTGSLQSLGDTLNDAKWGRNQGALAMMNRLGIGIHMTADGSVDAVRGFKDMANAISKIHNVQTQHLVARTFGLEAALPLLRKGAAGIEEYQRKIADFGGVSTKGGIEAAEQFGLQLKFLEAAAGGLKISIGSALMPVLMPLIDQLTKWISANRELIGQKVGEWVENVVTWFNKTDFTAIAAGIGKIAKAVVWVVEAGGKGVTVLQKLGALNMAGPQGVAGDTDARPSPKAALGSTRGIPLGIRSNNPLNMQPGGLEAVYPTMEAGISAAVRNLMSKRYFGGGNDTAAGIINTWSPASGAGNSAESTANYIKGVQAEVGTGRMDPSNPDTMAKLISAMIRQENGNRYDKKTMDAAVQHVVVEFKGAPAGTTATARTSSGASVPVRVATSMPTLVSP
jgi:hypothetical protein